MNCHSIKKNTGRSWVIQVSELKTKVTQTKFNDPSQDRRENKQVKRPLYDFSVTLKEEPLNMISIVINHNVIRAPKTKII